jgi:hypothetical protein
MGRAEAARQVLYYLSRERIKSTVLDRVVFHDKFFTVCHGPCSRWFVTAQDESHKARLGVLHDKLFVGCHGLRQRAVFLEMAIGSSST